MTRLRHLRLHRSVSTTLYKAGCVERYLEDVRHKRHAATASGACLCFCLQVGNVFNTLLDALANLSL